MHCSFSIPTQSTTHFHQNLILLSLISLGLLSGVEAGAGNTVYVGKQVSAKTSMDDIVHQSWNKLLSKYVDTAGRVNYEAWKATTADVRSLDEYLSGLSDASTRASATRQSKLAFWINAYNAVTVRGILREYPTTSIRNHTAKIWGYNIWKDLQLYVGGRPFSLEQMEHEILRKMSEPRIHFAIVCASKGCPRLLNEAFTADQVEDQLETNGKDFFARRQNFQFDAARNRFYLSAIMDWFDDDFGNSQAAQLRRISNLLPTPEASYAADRNAVSVVYLDYDWSLNAQ